MSDIQHIFARRLRQALIMKKMSVQRLTAALENQVSYRTLLKYRRGEMIPNDEVLSALCKVLHQSADFFFRPFRVELKIIHWGNPGKRYW